jgi:hypothetical protein
MQYAPLQLPATNAGAQLCEGKSCHAPTQAEDVQRTSHGPRSSKTRNADRCDRERGAADAQKVPAVSLSHARSRGTRHSITADALERDRAVVDDEFGHQAGLHHARRSRQAPTSTKRAMPSKILQTKGGWNRWDVKTEGCLPPQSGGSGIAPTESEQSGHTCDISAKRWIRTRW